MYETDIRDAISQLQAGSTSAPATLKLLALSPASTMEQWSLIISAIYAVLDDAHLSRAKADSSFPMQQALCLASLAPILTKGFGCSNMHSDALMTLMGHWPNLRLWIVYLKTDFVDQESVDLSSRIMAKKCITNFLGICDDFFLGDMFDTIVSSPGIITTLFSLWRLEAQDRRFILNLSDEPLSHPVFYIPGILDSWMCAFSHRESWDWSQILLAFGGEPSVLATTALDHLRQDVTRTPINYDLIIWGIHIITALSVNDTIRIPLLKHQSMPLLASVTSAMVAQRPDSAQLPLVAKCISYAYWYIRAYVESTEGLPWIIQLFEAGLLSAMLSTEPWIEHLGGDDSEDWEPLFLLLGQIMPKYSIYSSVLKPVIKQLAAVDASGLPGKLSKNGALFHAWTTFEVVVRDRVGIYKSGIKNETHIESCQNTKCDKSGPVGSFKSCAGCLHVHYCSKDCQVYDWKNGGHQKYCRDIQARRAEGLVSRLSKRDVLFIDRVITHDLGLFRNRIQGASMNSNPVVVELDYTHIPMGIDVGSIHTVPPVYACQCDVSMTQKWDHMVEIAQKSTSKKVLVRALLPGGTSERVKLQCLSLKRVLGDVTPAADEDPISEFDETFDLLYSRASQSFGVVDAAFPNEAMRAMKEKADMQKRDV